MRNERPQPAVAGSSSTSTSTSTREVPPAYAHAMQFSVLGPLVVEGDDGPIDVPGRKERTILALLLAHAGGSVLNEQIAEALWGEDLPPSARKSVQAHIAKLRRSLATVNSSTPVLMTRGAGYVLEVADEAVDAIRFERLVADGRHVVSNGSPADAAAAFREALELWKGVAYQDFLNAAFASLESDRLTELRRSAFEDLVEARLALGHHRELVPDLERVVAEEPLRERHWAQLMLALYRSSRQADALGAYDRCRETLGDELGIDPSEELQRLQTAILRHDPQLAHDDTLGVWVEVERAARVGAATGRAATARADLVRARDVIADNVIRLPVGGGEEPRRPADQRSRDACPYKGLAPFGTDDAAVFAGREALIGSLLARLSGPGLVGLVGTSGSGKSSLLRAGVVPAILAGSLPGSHRWRCAVLRPGERPMSALAHALGAAGLSAPTIGTATGALADDDPDVRLLLLVDQLEEVFTACRSIEERIAFLDELVSSVSAGASVVAAIRADHYGRCVEHPAFARALAADHVPVGPMAPDELRRAIEVPAQCADATIEPGVADELVHQAVGAPGALPLLSTALVDLWHRGAGSLRFDDLHASGGLDGAVARLAERAYLVLPEKGRETARRVLVRLAGAGEGDAVVGRRVSFDELRSLPDPGVADVVDHLVTARLLTSEDDAVEVAHEALFREWPRLRAWLDDDAEGRRLHRHLRESAAEWDRGGRDAGDLYRGVRLTAAMEWAAERGLDLADAERAFLDASRKASEMEGDRQRRANRRLRVLVAGITAFLVVALVAGGAALVQQGRASRAASVATAQRLGAQALIEENLDLAALLAREAVAIDDSIDTRSALLSVLLRSPAAIATMPDTGDRIQWIELSPDSATLLAVDNRGKVGLYHARALERTVVLDVELPNDVARFSPDGSSLALARIDADTGRPVLSIVDPRTGEATSEVILAEGVEVADLALALDARHLVTAERGGGPISLAPRDAVTGQPTGRDVALPAGAKLMSLAFSPNASTMLTAERRGGSLVLVPRDPTSAAQEGPPVAIPQGAGSAWSYTPDGRFVVASAQRSGTVVLDGRTLRPVRRFPWGGDFVMSADGRTLAIVSDGQRLATADIRTGRLRVTEVALPPVPTADDGLDLSDDGRTLAVVGGEDGDDVTLVDVRSGRTIETLEGHPGPVRGVEIASDGRTLFTSGFEGLVIAWDLTGERRMGRRSTWTRGAEAMFGPAQEVGPSAVSPDGRTLAYGTNDGRLVLFDIASGRVTKEFRIWSPRDRDRYAGPPLIFGDIYDGDDVITVVYAPGGDRIAVGGTHPEAKVVDLASGTVRRLPPQGDGPVLALDFFPDGRTLAVGGSSDGVVAMLDVVEGGRVGAIDTPRTDLRPDVGAHVWRLAISPDGERIATYTRPASPDPNSLDVWDVDTGRRLVSVRPEDPILKTIAWAPSGISVATGGISGLLEVWDAQTGERSTLEEPAVDGFVESLAFSPSGRLLAVAGSFETLRLFEARTLRPIGTSLTSGEWPTVADFLDDDTVFARTLDGEALQWRIDAPTLAERACELAGRALTPGEWRSLLPDRPYAPAC